MQLLLKMEESLTSLKRLDLPKTRAHCFIIFKKNWLPTPPPNTLIYLQAAHCTSSNSDRNFIETQESENRSFLINTSSDVIIGQHNCRWKSHWTYQKQEHTALSSSQHCERRTDYQHHRPILLYIHSTSSNSDRDFIETQESENRSFLKNIYRWNDSNYWTALLTYNSHNRGEYLFQCFHLLMAWEREDTRKFKTQNVFRGQHFQD